MDLRPPTDINTDYKVTVATSKVTINAMKQTKSTNDLKPTKTNADSTDNADIIGSSTLVYGDSKKTKTIKKIKK